MRKLKIVLPLMVFFALAIFVSSCSDDFTEEDALLLQGDLLEQKLRSESELATALATLQNQLAIALLDKQAQLDSLKAIQASQLAQMSAEAKAEYDAALAVLQGEIASMAAAQQAAIDSLKAVYQADLSAQARDHEAEIAAMLAEMKAAIDSLLAAQQGQIDQEMQLLLDSLARVGGIINYSVNVVPAGNASFGQGATNVYSKTDVAGIRVIASQNGITYETVTDAGGIAHFPNMRVGNVAVTVLGQAVDHTDLRFVADLSVQGAGNGVDYSKITRNAGTRVALFPVGASPLAATLNGQLTYEQDLTNDEREAVSVGVPVLARLNANTNAFRSRYFNTAANGWNGLSLGGSVVSMAYDPAVSRGAVTGTDGTYTITGAPASLDGLELELVVNDFAQDQTLLLDRLNDRDYPRTPAAAAATGKVANVRTFFSTSGTAPTAVPTPAAAFVMVPAPTNVYAPGTGVVAGTPIGSGAAATGVVGPLSGGIQAISVTNTGSGYSVAPTVSLPAPETVGGVQATAVATINADGNVSNITVTNPGSGYQGNNYTATIVPATVNATAVASVTYSVTGATAGTSFNALAASPAAFGNAGVYTLASVAPTVTVAGGNGGAPAATIAAKMTTAVYGATVTAGGTGYTSAPQVSISQPGGSGTGAQGVANLRKQVSTVSDRTVAGPPVTNLRSGFYSAAPVVTFNQPAGATRAQGTAVLGTTGRVNSNPNANLGAFQWWAPGVYYTTTDQLNVRRPRLQDSVAVAGQVNRAVLTFTGGASNDLNPGESFTVSARRMGWITDNGGTGFDLTVEFTIQDLNPTVNAQADQGGANVTYDRELRVSALTVAAQGSGYDAANLPVVAVNIASLLGPSGSLNDVNDNPNAAGAGYEAVTGGFRLIQNSGTNPLNFEFRSQANLQTSLIVERQVASITVTNPGSYALADAITFALGNPTPPAPAVLLGGTFEAGTEGAGAAAVGNEFRINTTNTVESVTITQIGSGYNPADLPTITFLGGGGTGATATLVMAQGVAGYEVTNGSFGYSQDAVVTITGGTIVAGSPARTAPSLTYGNGRVTSAQILNPGSGIMAPNGTLRGTITGQAATGGHGIQTAGNAGAAEFTFTVTGGQLSAVAINKPGVWAVAPTFPLTVTNFVITVAAHDGTSVAVGNATNTNANIRAAVPSSALPIMGVVDVNVSNGGSGYTTNPSVAFAASTLNFGTPAAPRNATGTAVVVGGVVQDVNITSSGVYAVGGANAGPIAITFTSATTGGAAATPGTYVGGQAYVALTVDPNTGRVIGGTVTDGGSGYTSIPALTVYASIPGVGQGAEVEILNRSAIPAGTVPTGGGVLSNLRVNNGGSGYFGRNHPSAQGVMFYGTNNTNMVTVVSGGTHAKDIYLGTGQRTIVD